MRALLVLIAWSLFCLTTLAGPQAPMPPQAPPMPPEQAPQVKDEVLVKKGCPCGSGCTCDPWGTCGCVPISKVAKAGATIQSKQGPIVLSPAPVLRLPMPIIQQPTIIQPTIIQQPIMQMRSAPTAHCAT